MAELERLRDALTEVPEREYFDGRAAAGWRLTAVEWQRPAEGAGGRLEEVPYGLRVAADCDHLEEHPREMEVLSRMLTAIAEDLSLSEVADELNRHGLRDRAGRPWTQVATFNLLPRLIEAAPGIRRAPAAVAAG